MSVQELFPIHQPEQEVAYIFQPGSIDELVHELSRNPATAVIEVPVWGAGAIDIEAGQAGAIHTKGLNGCHVTIITGSDNSGRRTVGMTHFPPDFAKDRYKRTVRDMANALEAKGVSVDQVVTVVDRNVPDEVSVTEDCFPGADITAVVYDRKATGRHKLVDKGSVLALIDYCNTQSPCLIVASEMGIKTFGLDSNNVR